MAFKLMTSETFVAKCDIVIPGKDCNKTLKVDIEYTYIDQSRIDALLTGQLDGEESDITLVDDVLVGWNEKQFVDHENKPIAYNDDNRAQALVTPFVRSAMLRTFLQAINGNQSRRKN